MTTILNWLETLPSPIRERAIENCRVSFNGDTTVVKKSVGDALVAAFSWENSPEGLDYWNRIYEGLLNPSLEELKAKVSELEKALAEKSAAWIPVSERLPDREIGFDGTVKDYSETVLVMDKSSFKQMAYLEWDGKKHYWESGNDEAVMGGIMYWMKIPELVPNPQDKH